MNLTLEIFSSIIILVIGFFLINKIQYDYKLIKIFREFPLPTSVRSGSFAEELDKILDKMYVFVQNFRYSIETEGVEVAREGNVLRVSGDGVLTIHFEAWGYFDTYRVKRAIRVISS